MIKILEGVLTGIIVVFLFASIAGFILDMPVLVSYVYSDSMNPTLKKGDFFFINPLSKGDVGDIIVYNMKGQWTVHRIYAKGAEGYITKGDNNIATDQQEGKNPEIKSKDIIGKVIVIKGTPLTVPKVGGYVKTISNKISNFYVAAALLIFGGVLVTLNDKNEKKRKRQKVIKIKFKTVYIITSALTIAILILSMMLSWGTLSFGYSSTLAGGQNEGWYLPESTFEKELSLQNRAVYPFYYFIEPRGDRIQINGENSFKISSGENKDIKLTINVPKETRLFTEKIDVYAYLPIVPISIIGVLYSKSPYLPFIAYIGEAALLFLLLHLIAGVGNEEVIRYRVHRSGTFGIFKRIRRGMRL
jgi:signal peptidase